MSRDDVTIGIDIGTTAVKAVAADDNGRVTARVRIGHQLAVPAPDRLEHDADEAWRRGPLAALDRLVGPDTRALAVAAMVPSLTAVDPAGRPITPGLLYGDARGRVPNASVARAQSVPSVGETAEFLRWTAGQALDASGYWPAPAVANYALSGEAVIDYATAVTTLPLFDGTGWNATACADCGVTVDRMPRVETFGVGVGQVRGTGAVLAVGAVDALCEQIVAGADRDGDVLVLCGATLIVWTTISAARQVPGLWTIPHTAPGKSQIGGASNAGGLFLNWVDRVIGPGDPALADPRRVPVWLPYIRGERTPFHEPDRRAVLDGVDLSQDAASVRRAAYEASGFVVRQLIELSGRRWRASWRQAAAPGYSLGCRLSPTRPAGRWRCPGWPKGRHWERLSSAAWRPDWNRRSPTLPGGPQPTALSNPVPTGRGRPRNAIAGSWRSAARSWPDGGPRCMAQELVCRSTLMQ